MITTRHAHIWVCGAVMLLLEGGLVAPVSSAQTREMVPLEQIHRNVARSFVIVNYYPQKSERPRPESRDPFDSDQRTTLQKILSESTISAVGIIISDRGDVLTTEKELQHPDTVARITVTGPDGTILPAQADRLLVKAPGQVLRITAPRPETWRALEFVTPAAVTPDTVLYSVALDADEYGHIHVNKCSYRMGWGDPDVNASLRISVAEGPAIICDEEGRPVGATVSREIDLGPAGAAWSGKDILADPGISADEQRQLEEKITGAFARNIYEVTIAFRADTTRSDPYDYDDYGPFESRRSSQDRVVYGLGFSDDKILVPQTLPRQQIEGIDTIVAKVADRRVPARFGGVLKRCSAMVIELEEGALPETVTFADGTRPVRIQPFWTVHVRELAGVDLLVEYCRWVTKERGIADKWYPVMDRPILSGSWLLDRQGRLVGLFAQPRRELDRLQRYLLSDGGRFGITSAFIRRSTGSVRSYYTSEGSRVFEAAELAPMLANLTENYDAYIRHLSKEDQKRRMWLGVEYTRPSTEMVKQMNMRQQTQDGRIGLMVNRVYAESPAAKLDLAEGDVLLKLTVPEAPWPIELSTDERGTSYGMRMYDEEDIPEELRAMGLRIPRGRPWPSRDNYLTRMLGDIGAGTPVKLSYFHDGQVLEKGFVVELAPPDIVSAAKYKSEKLGLTVRDLTYEVRAGLQLSESEAAVVIDEVEQGTPAALARISQYELIRAVDGQQIDDVQTFEKLITSAQEAGKESVRLTVEWMGKTRLADLKFSAKASAPSFLRSLLPGGGDGR